MPTKRVLSGAIAGLLVLVLAACTNTGSGEGTTAKTGSVTTSNPFVSVPQATATTSPALLASNNTDVKRFLALVNMGLRATSTATYKETWRKPARPPSTTVVVTQRGSQWSSTTAGLRVFYLDSGLFYCQPSTPSSSWQCHHGGPGMGGVFFLTYDDYPPNGLSFELQNALFQALASSVRLYSRTIDRRLVTCLAFSRGSDQGNTWCILATGQSAYFWSSGGSTQPGPQSFTLTRVSDVVPASALVLPAVPSSTPA